jgi:AhpD family alkylhydroperoxidase
MISNERRTYRFREFLADSFGVLVRLPLIVRARVRRRVSNSFESKLMLTVTAVNGCRYCAWVHSGLASRRHVAPEEVRALLAGAIDRPVGDDEASGLLFAQHYAQRDRRPDSEAVARLRDAYGRETADEIMLILRIISLGSLSGNTFKSFLERVRGAGSGGPGLWDELLVFLATAPLFGPIGLMMRREASGRAPR